jgi:hypothetical protein
MASVGLGRAALHTPIPVLQLKIARQTLHFPIAVANRFEAASSIDLGRRRRRRPPPTLLRFRQCASRGCARHLFQRFVFGANGFHIRIPGGRYPRFSSQSSSCPGATRNPLLPAPVVDLPEDMILRLGRKMKSGGEFEFIIAIVGRHAS